MKLTFKSLFSQMAGDFGPAGVDKDWKYYLRTAERIHLEKKSSVMLVCLLLVATLVVTIFVEEMRLVEKRHIISDQRMLLTVEREDSIKFKCVHCGWEHTLQLVNNPANERWLDSSALQYRHQHPIKNASENEKHN